MWHVWCIVVAAVSTSALQELYLNNEFGSRGKNKGFESGVDSCGTKG
jgi:hypothetical protein